MLIDAQPRRLAVRDEADPIEARVPHAFDDLIGRARQHMTPVAGELDGRGKQRRSLLDRGRKLHHGSIAPFRVPAAFMLPELGLAAAEPATSL